MPKRCAIRRIGVLLATNCMYSRATPRQVACATAPANSSAAEAMGAPCRNDGQRDFGRIAVEGHVRHADEQVVIVVDAQDRVACEVDAIDVGGEGRGRQRPAEAQPPVGHRQGEQMRDQRGARAFV